MAQVKERKYTEEEMLTIEKAKEILARQKAQRDKMKERLQNNPELKAKARDRGRRKIAENTLFIKKAKAAGIKVTSQEIDQYLASRVGSE